MQNCLHHRGYGTPLRTLCRGVTWLDLHFRDNSVEGDLETESDQSQLDTAWNNSGERLWAWTKAMTVEENRKEGTERSSEAGIKIIWWLVGHWGSGKRITGNIQVSLLGDSSGDDGISLQVENKQDVSVRLHMEQPGENAGLAVDRGLYFQSYDLS